MARLCEEGCHIVCDFCIYYKDDGIDEFEGEGICKLSGNRTDAISGCNNFVCMNLDDEIN